MHSFACYKQTNKLASGLKWIGNRLCLFRHHLLLQPTFNRIFNGWKGYEFLSNINSDTSKSHWYHLYHYYHYGITCTQMKPRASRTFSKKISKNKRMNYWTSTMVRQIYDQVYDNTSYLTRFTLMRTFMHTLLMLVALVCLLPSCACCPLQPSSRQMYS